MSTTADRTATDRTATDHTATDRTATDRTAHAEAFATARSKGLSYQELLDTDTHAVPAVLRLTSKRYLGSDDVPVERYLSRAYHELEKERLWSRVWQMACREEDIPGVGDTIVYDICDWSILVVRSAPDEIKAFYNACLHRGRQLREFAGRVGELRCPFHGFAWELDGALKHVPAAWDFPQIDAESFRLPEVRVGTWGGFVFINMDPACEPLEAFLGDLPAHFERWPLEKRYKQVHVAKIMRANWKAVAEAFMEAYHVVATHPQLLPGIGDANSQYDTWENFSRAITPNGTPSPHLSWTPDEQVMADSMVDRRLDEPAIVTVAAGSTARQTVAAGAREMYRPIVGDSVDELCDAEMVDSIYYSLFPNLHPWGAFNRIVYRFRPYGDDHETSIMECMFLVPYDEAKPPPPATPIHWLGPDDDWTAAPELGLLARVFNQDSYNLPKVQRGMKTLQKAGLTLANYQEAKLRHFHRLYDRWVGRPDPA